MENKREKITTTPRRESQGESQMQSATETIFQAIQEDL